MKEEPIVREATAEDKPAFIEMAIKLALYNRQNHNENSKYDNFDKVLDAIKSKAVTTFTNRGDEVLVLIAERNKKTVGYALARIVQEEATADNGTGKTGLFDELYVDETARGLKLGQRLTECVITWMKSKGLHRIKLHAYAWNTAARKLYERNGFTVYASSFEKFI